ncbi:hypothetical protein OESDEN_15526, partial [Oesophagostomum dentatum]
MPNFWKTVSLYHLQLQYCHQKVKTRCRTPQLLFQQSQVREKRRSFFE